jgi:hypothetical protein
MKTYSIVFAMLLTGCSTTVPVAMKFPDIPPSLDQRCVPLDKIQGEKVSIVDLHKTVVDNYTKYHECSIKVESWLEWYTIQKKIYESLK